MVLHYSELKKKYSAFLGIKKLPMDLRTIIGSAVLTTTNRILELDQSFQQPGLNTCSLLNSPITRTRIEHMTLINNTCKMLAKSTYGILKVIRTINVPIIRLQLLIAALRFINGL